LNLGNGNHSHIYVIPQFFQNSGPKMEVHCTPRSFFKIMLIRIVLQRYAHHYFSASA
jgi:hypothetical protein